MTIRSFYLPQMVLEAINTGALVNGSTEGDLRGQVKSAKITFSDFENTVLDGNDTYIETLDGQKYYMGLFWNNNVSVNLVNDDLELSFIQDAQIVIESGNGIYHGLALSDVRVFVELDEFDNPIIEAAYSLQNNMLVLPSTPVIWSGNGGGGPSTPGFASYDGKVVGTVADNPTQVEVTFNGQPLPTGSVVKFNGQKFLKVSGGSMEFLAIEVTPKPEWGWALSADADWAVLQNI